MARATAPEFRSPVLADLLRRLETAAAGLKAGYVLQAERLHDELDPAASYPLDYIIFRVCRYRSEAGTYPVAAALDIQADLRLIINELSRDPTFRDDQPVATVVQLSERLGVSTKTILRWRKRGLRWRWQHDGQGSRVVVTESALAHFRANQPGVVERAAAFSQLQPALRQALLGRARRLRERAPGVSLHRVATHLARKSGRAVETVRQMLMQHDVEYPLDPIFADRDGPLSVRQRRAMARAAMRGESVTRIARRYGRTRSTVYRAVHQHRAAVLRRLPLHYTVMPTFMREDADEVLLGSVRARPDPQSATERAVVPVRSAEPLPEPLAAWFSGPGLSAGQQRQLYACLNYLKYKADRARRHFHPVDPRAADLDHVEAMVREAARVRDDLVRGALPGVLATARRHMLDLPEPSGPLLLELLEAGTAVVLEAVQRQALIRGGTFESHLSYAMMRRFAPIIGPQQGQEHPGDEDGQESPPRRSRARKRATPESAVRRIRSIAAAWGVRLDVGDAALLSRDITDRETVERGRY